MVNHYLYYNGPVIEHTSPTIPQKSFWGEILELVRFALLAAIIVIPIRVFIAQPFIVSGSSMVPTFENRDYLIVDELSYRLEEPSRGDVVIFRYPNDTSKYFIKRMIGLPGETVRVEGDTVTIKNEAFPEGFVLEEPYIKNHMTGTQTVERTLKPDEYFVMGDNRPASSDSRFWGPVPKEDLVGRAFLRLYPLKELGVFPGEHHVYESTQ